MPTVPCLKKVKHEKVVYSYSEMGEDVYVCLCCGHEFIEKVDGCG